jgi:hypothetical protein
MPTGNRFSLSAFEARIADDPEILGVLYTGSQGRGDMDRYSDLDIKVWARDSLFDRAESVLRELLETLGEIHYAHPPVLKDSVTATVGPEWQRVDLDLLRDANLTPKTVYGRARVAKDTDGTLARLVSESPKAPTLPTLEAATEFFSGMPDSQIYLTLHNARGAVWSAMGEITYEAGELYTFLARLSGAESYGFRFVERILNDDERALLEAAWPAQPTRDEVRRAARALWTWTRFVRRETERVLGEPLPLSVDEEGLSAAIDRIYEWE